MAVQFAKKLGNRVTVFTTSPDQAEFAHKIGADEAIVVGKDEIPQFPSSKLDILLSTVPAVLDWVPYIDFLDSDGALAFVGVPDAPLSIPLFSPMAKRRRIMASPAVALGLIKCWQLQRSLGLSRLLKFLRSHKRIKPCRKSATIKCAIAQF
jgi:D-arabinose 1-dehydrogenase-like Zn-dependent alcohol dehydrogenase